MPCLWGQSPRAQGLRFQSVIQLCVEKLQLWPPSQNTRIRNRDGQNPQRPWVCPCSPRFPMPSVAVPPCPPPAPACPLHAGVPWGCSRGPLLISAHVLALETSSLPGFNSVSTPTCWSALSPDPPPARDLWIHLLTWQNHLDTLKAPVSNWIQHTSSPAPPHAAPSPRLPTASVNGHYPLSYMGRVSGTQSSPRKMDLQNMLYVVTWKKKHVKLYLIVCHLLCIKGENIYIYI